MRDYETEEFGDEDIVSRAKRYAAKHFDSSLRGESVARHDINNATKIVGFLLKASEAADKAPELGVILQELRRSDGAVI